MFFDYHFSFIIYQCRLSISNISQRPCQWIVMDLKVEFPKVFYMQTTTLESFTANL